MKMKSVLRLAAASAFLSSLTVVPAAFAHQTYNVGALNGPAASATGWLWSVGANAEGNNAGGVANTTGGADGAINNSQASQGGSPVVTGNLVWRSGVGAVEPEYTGNLPEMWYAGLHNTATGLTTREIGTVSGGVGGTQFITPGSSLDARIATWNTAANVAQGIGLDPNAQIAVQGNSWLTGNGLDYGVTHITCGGSADGCLADGNQTVSWTLKNLNSLSSSLLGIAVYGGWDTSTSSSRTALFNGNTLGGLINPQGSSLTHLLWSATMTNPTDVLTYSRYFDAAESALYGGEYTVIIGALNNTGDGQYYLSNRFGVPVPPTLWLFGIGLVAMGAFNRRKQISSN
jgi:hypothetical protein